MVQMSGFSQPNNSGAGGGDDWPPNKPPNKGSRPDLQEKLRRRHQKRAMSRASSSSNSQNTSPVPRLDEGQGHHGASRGHQQVSHLRLSGRSEHNSTPDMSLNDPDGNGNFMFYDGEEDCPTPSRSFKRLDQGQGHVDSAKGQGHGAHVNVPKPDVEDSALNTVLGEIQNNKLRKTKKPREESGAVFQNNFDDVESQPVAGLPDRMRPHVGHRGQQHPANRFQGRGEYRELQQEDEDGDDEDTEPEDHPARGQGHNHAEGHDSVKQMMDSLMGVGQNGPMANNGLFGMEPNVAGDPLQDLFRRPQGDIGDRERGLAGINANNDPLAVLIGEPRGGIGGPIGGLGGPIGGLGGPIGGFNGPIGGLGGPIGGGPIGGMDRPIGGLGRPIGGLGGPIGGLGGPIGGLGGPIGGLGGPIGGLGALLGGGGGQIGGMNEEHNDNDNPFRQMFEGDGDNSFEAFFNRMRNDGHNADRDAQQRQNQLLGQQIGQGNGLFPGLHGDGDNQDVEMFDRMGPSGAENDDEKEKQFAKGHDEKKVDGKQGGWNAMWDRRDNPFSDDENADDDPLAFLSPIGRNGAGRHQAGGRDRDGDGNADPSRNPLHALFGGSHDNEGGEGLVQRTLQAMIAGPPGGNGQQGDPSQFMKDLMGSGQGSVPRRVGPPPVNMEFLGPNMRRRGQNGSSVGESGQGSSAVGSGPAAQGPAFSSQNGAGQVKPDVKGSDSLGADSVVPSQRGPGGQMMPSVKGTGPVGPDASVLSQRGSGQMVPSMRGSGPVGAPDASVYSQGGPGQMMPGFNGPAGMMPSQRGPGQMMPGFNGPAGMMPSQRGPGQMIPSPMGYGQRGTGQMRAGQMGPSPMVAGQMEHLPGDDIDPDNHGEQDVMYQLLELERMRAEGNTAPRADQALHTIIVVDVSGSMEGEPFLEVGRFISQFISSLEEIQFEYNQQENVALVCVGSSVQVVQHFTNNYTLIRNAADTLLTGGPSKLHLGLLLPNVLLNHGSHDQRRGMGGVFQVGSHHAQPRVILISDGNLTMTEDQPGQAPQADDKVTMMMQNLCFTLVQSTAEKTLMKIYCVPIGTNVNMNFLEMLSQSTGGRVVQPTEARYLSRSVLHHGLVAMLKQTSEVEPNRDTVIQTLQQVTATADDVDVNGIFEVYREGEPDLAARDQRELAEAIEQQQALMQGGKGAGMGQGIPGRPGLGSNVGGGIGGGAGMFGGQGVPAIAAMLGGQANPGRGGNAGGGMGGGAGMFGGQGLSGIAAMLGGQANPGRGGNAGGGMGGGAGMFGGQGLSGIAAMLGGQANPGRGGNADGGMGGGAGMFGGQGLSGIAAMLGGQANPGRGGNADEDMGGGGGMFGAQGLSAMLGGQANPDRGGNAGEGMGGGAGMFGGQGLSAIAAMLGGQANPGRGGNAGGGIGGGAGMFGGQGLPAMLGGQVNPDRAVNQGNWDVGNGGRAGMMLPDMLGGQADPGIEGNEGDGDAGNGGGAKLVLPGLAALLEQEGIGMEGNANQPEYISQNPRQIGSGDQVENSNYGFEGFMGNRKNQLNNERQNMPGGGQNENVQGMPAVGQNARGMPGGLAELMRLDQNGGQDFSGLEKLSGVKGDNEASRNGPDALFGRQNKPNGDRPRHDSDYDVMFSGFQRDRELRGGDGSQERGGVLSEADLEARQQGVGGNDGASMHQVEPHQSGNGQLGLHESMFQAPAGPMSVGASAALPAGPGQIGGPGNMETKNSENRHEHLGDLEKQMAAMRASDNNGQRDANMVQGGPQGMNGRGLVLGNPHQVQRRMQQMRLIQQQQRRQREMYQPIQVDREPVFQGGNPNQHGDMGGLLRQQPYNGGGQGMPGGILRQQPYNGGGQEMPGRIFQQDQRGPQVEGQYYNRQPPQGGEGGNPGQYNGGNPGQYNGGNPGQYNGGQR